ncbi:MAG TPA: hypothetical protein VMI75_10425 [Polyangiaceae bacterium]|nr:hypothetical protein [Polyangiaceae bacterium]
MRTRASAFAAVALLALSVCVAAASCGLDTSGLGEAAHDGSTKPKVDAPASKDGPGPKGDAPGGEAQGDAPDDVSANDAPITPDVQPGDDGPSEDAPSLEDVTDDAPPPPTCTGCMANQCCNDKGMCANAGNKSCGGGGATCVDCTNSPLGNQCVLITGVETCGCAGPGNQNQCPMNNACHNNQCGTSCDGQHPCNGGCCSGNDLATSTCVTACTGGMMCTMNFCH